MKISDKKILVIGSYNVGLACKSERIPVWGETLMGNDFSESNGGKGANQAVAAARLGGNVSFVGCLGKDRFGKDGIEMLQKENVDISGLLRSDKHTGVGFIFINPQGENCILVAPGANNELSPEDVLNSGKIEESDIIIFQLENCLETVELLMEHAKKLRKTVIFNPAPANSAAWNLLQYANVVNPNESELLLLNRENPDSDLTLEKCEKLANRLLEKGPKAIIVTRGSKGALLVTREKVIQIPSKKVDVIDTTGAGDSFTGALAVALSEGKSLEEAACFANNVGAYSVTKRDVIPSLPNREQLDKFLEGGFINSIL